MKIHKIFILVIILAAFVVGVISQAKFNLPNLVLKTNFINFPDIKNQEYGLLSDFDLTDTLFKSLVQNGKLVIKNRTYKLITSEDLSSDIKSFRVEVNHVAEERQAEEPPLAQGLIVLNQKSNSAIQLYDQFVSLKPKNTYGTGFSNIAGESFLNDINKDGLQEFLVSSSTGGNGWAGSKEYIFQITNNGGYKLLSPTFVNENNKSIQEVKDLDGDGVDEIVVIDSGWEITSCTDHASAPYNQYVYSWDDKKGYVENSAKYPKFYQDTLEFYNNIKDINGNESKICSGDMYYCFGPALSQYFAYKNMGKEAEGWNRFLQLTHAVNNSMWPSKACREFVIKEHDLGKPIIPPDLTIDQLMESQ